METVIPEKIQTKPAIVSYSMWSICLVGAMLGLAFWGITKLVGNFMIQPIFCHSAANVTTCLQSTNISGDIASVLVAALGIVVMVGLKMVRPLIISISSAAVLWGLASWTSGLGWIEATIWCVFLYSIAYVLFSWIARYLLLKPVIASMLIIVIIARIALAL